MILLGIDEAGRGPVIGPMAVAAVAIHESRLGTLEEIGVADSKRLSATRRRKLAPQIIAAARAHRVHLVTPAEIDQYGLTACTFDAVVALLGETRPDALYIDALGALARDNFIAGLRFRNAFIPSQITYEKKADATYPIVAAASILAKVARDARIERLHEEIGEDFGSGYPNARTIDFIRAYRDRHGHLPPGVRRTWSCVPGEGE